MSRNDITPIGLPVALFERLFWIALKKKKIVLYLLVLNIILFEVFDIKCAEIIHFEQLCTF